MVLLIIILLVIGIPLYAEETGISPYAAEGSVNNSMCSPEAPGSAILVSKKDLIDAVSAGVLSYEKKAPLLLMDDLPENVPDIMKYMNGKVLPTDRILIIGGTNHISQEFTENLNSLGYLNIKRLAGEDRFTTNILINQELGIQQADRILLVSGNSLADGISVLPAALKNKWPLILIPNANLGQKTADYIAGLNPQKVSIIGGQEAISYYSEGLVRALLPEAEIKRVCGYDRFSTSVKVIEEFFPNPTELYLADGSLLQDALCGSMQAAETDAPLAFLDGDLEYPSLELELYLHEMAKKGITPTINPLNNQFNEQLVANTGKSSSEEYISPRLKSWLSLKQTDFVDLRSYIPSLSFELRYATKNNIAGRVLYSTDTPYLRKGTADKLKQAAAEFEQDGYYMLIWDAYRPPSVQMELWRIVNDSRYIANPFNGWSYHNRGSAIDCTLLDRNGILVDMPTEFDSFTTKADRNYNDVTREQAENAVYLESVMKKHGFLSIQTEWWHFNDSDKYDLAYSASPPY